MSSQPLQQHSIDTTVAHEGRLLGIVLDLSGSMYESVNNDAGRQISRIEGLVEAFRHVMDDVQLSLKENTSTQQGSLRLFIHGFGFWSQDDATQSSSIGDVLAVLANLDQRVKHYQPLQQEMESLWTEEVVQILEARRITGDAKEELCLFVEQELKEQAIQAEQQRSTAKFQRWCASACLRLSAFDSRLRGSMAHYQGWKRIFLPFLLILLWLLRGAALTIAYLNSVFESWLRRKLMNLRDNAHLYAAQQAEKVSTITQQALDKYHGKIAAVIDANLIAFLDREAFNMIGLYQTKRTASRRRQAFDRNLLRQVDAYVSQQISDIMTPQANFAWNKSTFLFKQAARALKISPNWTLLKEKTLRCAHQIVWEVLTPEVKSKAKTLAKARLTRAVLITIVQQTKDQRKTLALGELADWMKQREIAGLSVDELPIFGPSPLGQTLTQTAVRLWQEAHLPHNEGLLPAIIVISDGKPTDESISDVVSQAEEIKQIQIPMVCCYVTNKDVGRPWILRQRPGWFWPEAAKGMFAMASCVEEWPQLGRRLTEGRFAVKKQAKLFIQINHTEYLRNIIEAILLPVGREQRLAQKDPVDST